MCLQYFEHLMYHFSKLFDITSFADRLVIIISIDCQSHEEGSIKFYSIGTRISVNI
jgi:hypothetical protein